MTTFKPSTSLLQFGSLDDTTLTVQAQYNPKEVAFVKPISWSPHQKQGSPSDGLQLEFAGTQQPRTASIDLLFDAVEENDSSYIIGAVSKLERMASVQDMMAKDDTKRRPHHCILVWGDNAAPSSSPDAGSPFFQGTSKFQCVITSLTVTYQVFSSAGLPLRAKVTLALQEASRVMMAPAGGSSSSTAPAAGSGSGAPSGGST